MKGSEEFAYEWLGTPWYFASGEHRELFISDPAKYAPQYGGYCTRGVANGNTRSISTPRLGGSSTASLLELC